ncbi:hypothetical protein [Pseudonocardia sp. KRD291]|uniref:hypothetical protein n=1 Tax=Pseudonocardia sp. KRD291 TaxID=2792007 RepID=UPI001C4A6C4E|nr:hypothetical protein [Pseudonocardia sp. KRD291]MBW0104315.1 LuxR family transcriptional regulator [Pseudonocardia sp. KRD291]
MADRDEAAGVLTLVPDLDDDLVVALGQVEELLMTLAGWEEDPDGPGPFVLPSPLAGRVAVDALNRIQTVLTPTQTRTWPDGRERPLPPGPGQGRLFGADGRYEHRPLRLIALDPADLATLGAAAAALGQALAAGTHSELVEAMEVGAQAAAASYEPVTAAGLVEVLTRAHGLLDLADTAVTAALRGRLVAAGGADVVLTAAEDAAYARLVDRTNAMWTSSDPLDRWLY